MGLDLSRLVPSLIFGFAIFIIMATAFASWGTYSGVSVSDSQNFNINHTMTVALDIESGVKNSGDQSALNQFFPAIGTLFNIWNLISAAVDDFREAINIFFMQLGVGGAGLMLIKVAIIISIILAIAFIILAALFRQNAWRVQ